MASTFKLANGYELITIHLMKGKQNAAYRGTRILYLYPWKNGRGYYSAVYELILDLKYTMANKGNFAVKNFSGIINNWDLQAGFQHGLKFTNGVAEKKVSLEIRPPINTASASSSRTAFDPITLPNVTVYATPQDGGTYYITFSNSSYNAGYVWGGGGNWGSNNPCEYTSCTIDDPFQYFDEDFLKAVDDVVAESLYQFAQAKVITTTLSYCQDLAWSGLTKSRAFEDLSQYVQDRIKDRVNAEKDPNATHGDSNGNYVNANNISAKGHHPCI